MKTTLLSGNIFNHDLARRYALFCFITHFLFITLSLIPGWRTVPSLSGDAVTYVAPAQNILHHGAFSRESAAPYLWEPYRTPGYPLLIAASIALLGNYQWVLYVAAITAGLAGWCAVRLTEEWGGSRLAQHIAGTLVALLPNSLGLSGMLLADAVFGHLVLFWVYLLYVTFSRSSFAALVASTSTLWFLQALKPTLTAGASLILWASFLFFRSKQRWGAITAILVVLSLLLPSYFASRNLRDHGVFTPTLLGVETFREYLQVRYLAVETGADYTSMTNKIREADKVAANRLAAPRSFYGRLYQVKKAEVMQFLRGHPWLTFELMATEILRQFAAPQEFAFRLFLGDLPTWMRAMGSLITVVIWAVAALGAWHLGRSGDWKPGLLVVGVLVFFLLAGSISHRVGARLRFPADLVAIPLAAVGTTQSLISLCSHDWLRWLKPWQHLRRRPFDPAQDSPSPTQTPTNEGRFRKCGALSLSKGCREFIRRQEELNDPG